MRFGVVCMLAVTIFVAGCGGNSGGPRTSEVASAAGASNCDDSGYYIVSKLTSDKAEIYDCAFGTFPLKEKCVTYENGVANDSTAIVRLAFSTKLGSGRPSCLGG